MDMHLNNRRVAIPLVKLTVDDREWLKAKVGVKDVRAFIYLVENGPLHREIERRFKTQKATEGHPCATLTS
jgi:hypothetical protein